MYYMPEGRGMVSVNASVCLSVCLSAFEFEKKWVAQSGLWVLDREAGVSMYVGARLLCVTYFHRDRVTEFVSLSPSFRPSVRQVLRSRSRSRSPLTG